MSPCCSGRPRRGAAVRARTVLPSQSVTLGVRDRRRRRVSVPNRNSAYRPVIRRRSAKIAQLRVQGAGELLLPTVSWVCAPRTRTSTREEPARPCRTAGWHGGRGGGYRIAGSECMISATFEHWRPWCARVNACEHRLVSCAAECRARQCRNASRVPRAASGRAPSRSTCRRCWGRTRALWRRGGSGRASIHATAWPRARPRRRLRARKHVPPHADAEVESVAAKTGHGDKGLRLTATGRRLPAPQRAR